jgi:hypothetical protein
MAFAADRGLAAEVTSPKRMMTIKTIVAISPIWPVWTVAIEAVSVGTPIWTIAVEAISVRTPRTPIWTIAIKGIWSPIGGSVVSEGRSCEARTWAAYTAS